jgi:thioredoxin-like negative regulator of GroEL
MGRDYAARGANPVRLKRPGKKFGYNKRSSHAKEYLMNPTTPELEQVVALAQNLSPLDKVRLVERLMATLEETLEEVDKRPRKSLLGVLSQFGPAPSAEEIDEARREMWGNFPRPIL